MNKLISWISDKITVHSLHIAYLSFSLLCLVCAAVVIFTRPEWAAYAIGAILTVVMAPYAIAAVVFAVLLIALFFIVLGVVLGFVVSAAYTKLTSKVN